MKRTWALLLSLVLVCSLASSALAYDGDIIKLKATSDGFYTFDPANDPMAKFILDTFGIEFTDAAYDGDMDKMRLDAMSGTLADVCYTDFLYNIPQISEFIDQEFFRAIPDEMLEKFPLTKKLLENDAVAQAIREEYGSYYMLPKPDAADPTVYQGERKGLFIRKDWLEKLGLEMPTSWEELYNVAHAFTYDDPDGNGQADTYGLTGDGMGQLRFFFASTGHTNRYWFKQADGTYTHGGLAEDNIEVLKWLRKMYEDGSIDPEFGSNDYKIGLQKFSSNRFGLCVRNADASWINDVLVKYYGEANPQVANPFDIISVIPSLSLVTGEKPLMEGYVSCMCATQFAYDLSDEYLERFLAMYEYLLSPEGLYLRLGFENVDWKYDENGNIVKIRDDKGVAPDLTLKYPSIALTHYPSWGFEMAADEKVEFFDRFDKETKELNTWARNIRNPGAVFPEIAPMLISDTAVTDANAFKFAPEYWTIISGTAPVEEMFAAMVTKAMQDGFKDAIEVVNTIATEKGW